MSPSSGRIGRKNENNNLYGVIGMSKLHLIWIVPVAITLSPVGWIAVYAITGTHWGAILSGIGFCILASGGDVGEDV